MIQHSCILKDSRLPLWEVSMVHFTATNRHNMPVGMILVFVLQARVPYAAALINFLTEHHPPPRKSSTLVVYSCRPHPRTHPQKSRARAGEENVVVRCRPASDKWGQPAGARLVQRSIPSDPSTNLHKLPVGTVLIDYDL